MKEILIFLVLGLGMTVSASEITVKGVGSDEESAKSDAKTKAAKQYQSLITDKIADCNALKEPLEVEIENYDILDIDEDGIIQKDEQFEATFTFDIESKDGVAQALEKACSEKLAAQKEDEQDARDAAAAKQAISDFGSRFNLGLTAYGLYGYGVGGYLEYRQNDFFSVYVNGSYNSTQIGYNTAADGTSDYKKAQEIVSAGVEMRLFIFMLGYEQVLNYTEQPGITVVTEPTSAYTGGIIIPMDLLSKSKSKSTVAPRFELGIYYKQYNDVLIVETEQQSDSFVGGLFIRARVF